MEHHFKEVYLKILIKKYLLLSSIALYIVIVTSCVVIHFKTFHFSFFLWIRIVTKYYTDNVIVNIPTKILLIHLDYLLINDDEKALPILNIDLTKNAAIVVIILKKAFRRCTILLLPINNYY